VTLHEKLAPHPFPIVSTTLGLPEFKYKKAAKQHAAKCAVQWLESEANEACHAATASPWHIAGKTLKQSETSETPSHTTPDEKRLTVDTSNTVAIPSSYSQQVAALCKRNNLRPPQYVFEENENYSAYWNVYAHFGSDPRVQGRIGEVRDIYTKKNAREECAKLLLQFLLDMEKHKLKAKAKKRQKRTSRGGRERAEAGGGAG
jgi:hypothetical protein